MGNEANILSCRRRSFFEEQPDRLGPEIPPTNSNSHGLKKRSKGGLQTTGLEPISAFARVKAETKPEASGAGRKARKSCKSADQSPAE
ncbi:hypothetical protein LZ554_004507 [Drepanopeziza brunnea f. sp. 'monogermtubi']|nr:hypothetical protein LZ554_004507 [Drepanopeziza brunnea f. sp. 'monogermtubi']